MKKSVGKYIKLFSLALLLRVRQTGANLIGANLRGAILNWTRLNDALIDDEQLSTVKSRLEQR